MTRFNPKGWECNNCGNFNDPEEPYCDSCGADTDGIEPEPENDEDDVEDKNVLMPTLADLR